MQSVFSVFLELGFDHILDPKGYDHILFVIALCAIYKISEWRKVAILVTAFTLGHSITLALAALNIIQFSPAVIEFLIPVTIFVTAVYNVIRERPDESDQAVFNRKVNLNYGFAAFFGLIHGMGFSNFFKSSLMPGEESMLVQQLFAFNIGVELGQLVIVAVILAASFLAFNVAHIKQREWTLFISGAAAGVAITLML